MNDALAFLNSPKIRQVKKVNQQIDKRAMKHWMYDWMRSCLSRFKSMRHWMITVLESVRVLILVLPTLLLITRLQKMLWNEYASVEDSTLHEVLLIPAWICLLLCQPNYLKQTLSDSCADFCCCSFVYKKAVHSLINHQRVTMLQGQSPQWMLVTTFI